MTLEDKKAFRFVTIKLFSWILFVCIFILAVIPPMASKGATNQTEKTTLRVAYYPLEGFFDYDVNGKEIGYGVDLLHEISKFTGIEFTYIPAETWESTKQMLLDGKADIRMPATAPVKPSTTLGYTENKILSTCHVIMTLKSRDDLYFEDYDNFSTMRVGITKSMYNSLDFGNQMSMFNLVEDQMHYFETYEAEKEALLHGKIDAIVSNIMDLDSDMMILERFSNQRNYISMTINNPYLKVLDNALNTIVLEEPAFFSGLLNKWFPERSATPLTREESEYVKSLQHITFSFRDGQGYLSRRENGEFVGFYPKIADWVGKQLGLEVVKTDLMGEDATGIIVYPDYYYDYDWAMENGDDISQAYFNVRYYEVTSKSSHKNGKDCKVAAVHDFRVTKDYINYGYPIDQMIWCKDYETCIQAVENGKADIAFINSYAAEYYLSMYRYANLNYSLTKFSHKACFGIHGDEKGILVSVLNKTLSTLSDEMLDDFMTESTSTMPKQDLMEEFIIRHPFRMIVFALLASAIVVSAILATIFAQKTKKKNIQLLKATKAKSEFLERMSHDIRTPLNVIIGMNHLARENDNPKDTDECLEKMEIASHFLLGLINDVLDMERVESGNIQLNPVPYSSKEFEEYINAVIRPLCEQKNINFEYEYQSDTNDDVVILQDKLRTNQIYFNLLSNSVKYTSENGKIKILTKVSQINTDTIQMDVSISDNGIGMSEEFQKHMFEAFTQENQAITPVSQGNGLGLSIVKKMCDLMKIELSVDSKLGVGTTFMLHGKYQIAHINHKDEANTTLNDNHCDKPLLHSETNKPVQNEFQQQNATMDSLKDKTILVCEDHPLNQEIIYRILVKMKMIVKIVDDGQKGVEEFKHSAPGTYDAILMDIRMPVMNGIEATKQIRAFDRSDAKTIPIIAMTANAYTEDRKSTQDAGMNEHLAKPIDPNKIYEVLKRYIG